MTEVTPRNQDAPVEAAADVATMTTPAEGGGTETKKEETKEDKPEGSTTTGSTTEETPSALKENDSTSGPPPEAEKPVVVVEEAPKAAPVVSANKRSRPAYKYDPNKITLRFLFANRDGLTVTVECKPLDTVSEVKGALLSVWPEGKKTSVVNCGTLICFVMERQGYACRRTCAGRQFRKEGELMC